MHRRRRVEGRQSAPVFGIVRAAVGTIAETRCRLGVKEWSCIGCAAETRHGPAGGVTVAPGRDGSPERPGTEQGGTPVTPNRAWSDPSPSNPIPRTPSGIITLGRASSAAPTSAPTRVRDLVSGHRFRPQGARTATPPTGASAAARASGHLRGGHGHFGRPERAASSPGSGNRRRAAQGGPSASSSRPMSSTPPSLKSNLNVDCFGD